MIIKFLYLSITKLYNYFFTFFENLFLRNNKINNSINKFKKLEQLNIQKIDFENFEKIITNKYLTKIIFPHKEIFQIAHNLFLDNNLAKKISGLTGFNYTISFFTAYKTFKIDAEEKKTK